MRLLVPGRTGLDPFTELDSEGLAAAYRPPSPAWLRANMVTTLDGAATGPDGRSGTINTDADHVVFELLRALSHCVVVGAGTVRAERYPALSVDPALAALREDEGLPEPLPLVVVSNSGDVPDSVRPFTDGSVLLAVPAGARGLDAARAALGPDHVLVHGQDRVDLVSLVAGLHARGWTRVHTEGGPALLGSLLAAGVVDELCFTVTPAVVAGGAPRPVSGPPLDVDLELAVLVEQDATLLGRWTVRR
jgi:riboflavin biosynthesis pyrimidine reductase